MGETRRILMEKQGWNDRDIQERGRWKRQTPVRGEEGGGERGRGTAL